eukprot:SAG31_NODE_793_length_12044_cov_12.886229_5_plen_123_part_00
MIVFCFHTVLHSSAGRLRMVVSGMSGTVEEMLDGTKLGPPKPLDGGPVAQMAVQQPLVQTIVNELTGSPIACPSKGPNAIRCARVIDKILDGYYGSRTGDFWAQDPSTWPGKAAAIERAASL